MNMKGVAFPSRAQTTPFYFCSFPANILEANDSLTQVINLYRQLVKGEEVSAEETTTQQPGRCARACLSLRVCSADRKQMCSVRTRFSPGRSDGAQHVRQHSTIQL